MNRPISRLKYSFWASKLDSSRNDTVSSFRRDALRERPLDPLVNHPRNDLVYTRRNRQPRNEGDVRVRRHNSELGDFVLRRNCDGLSPDRHIALDDVAEFVRQQATTGVVGAVLTSSEDHVTTDSVRASAHRCRQPTGPAVAVDANVIKRDTGS
jgi:hypothetical protein